jgi:hypothetical protein
MDTHDDINEHDFPLPEWAIKQSDGTYMEVGAQLCTRDGRKCGNAYVDRIDFHKHLDQFVAVVVTDVDNMFRMTHDELESYFFPPKFVMDVEKARKQRKFQEFDYGDDTATSTK